MGHDVDGAADRVASEESALRTLEDLDALDVQQVLVGTDRTGEEYAVDIDAYAGVDVEGEVVLADAANRGRQHGAVTREGRARIQVDVRGEIAQGVNIGHGFFAQRFGRESA